MLLFIGIRRSVRPPTELHPLGYGKERYFWALVVALFLFFGGGVFSLYEAVRRFGDPHALGDPTVGFIVLGLSFAFEAFSLSVAIREVRHAAAEAGVPALDFLRQLRDPALRTVVFEDSAALSGLVLAAAGLLLASWTGDQRFDALASASIGLVLILVAYALAHDARALITGEAPPAEVRDALRATLRAHADVDEVIQLLAVRIGAKQLLVMARISVGDQLRGDEIERLLITLRDDLQRTHPEVTEAFLEVNPGRAAATG